MKKAKKTAEKRITRNAGKRDRSRDNERQARKKRKSNNQSETENLPQLVTPPPSVTPTLTSPSASTHPTPVISNPIQVPASPTSSQGSSDSNSNTNQIPMHNTNAFKKYLKDVRTKAISGCWQEFDYEETAKNTRYASCANWLRENKPKLKQLLYNGQRTGYYKCVKCEERGCLHINKACHQSVSTFKTQSMKKHFDSKVHKENTVMSKQFEFSQEWKKAMDIKYLKMMAKHHVSGGIFKTEEFTDIIASWINEVSNTKIDVETVKKEIPDRRTLQRRLDDLSVQVRGKFEK